MEFITSLFKIIVSNTPLPRHLRRPAITALDVVAEADDWCCQYDEKDAGDFANFIFAPIYQTDEDYFSLMENLDSLCVEDTDPAYCLLMRVAILCTEAIRADKLGDLNLAWTYAVDASTLMGEIKGAYGAVKSEFDAIKNQARKGADGRHAGNRADKEKVFAWCNENMQRFSSMEDAAADIAGTFIPQKFGAVRRWMTDWNRQQSTSRS